jgi:hypothetical protein
MGTFFLVSVKRATAVEPFDLCVLGLDGIVPLTMKGISDEVEGAQFSVGDDDACGIVLAVLDGSNVQSFFGGGVGDQLNDGFQRC